MRQIQVVLKDGVTWPEETATSSPTSSTQSSGALGSPTASSPAAPSNPGTVGKSGLSTGAIAGIAVGAVALFALMAIGAFILFRRRKRNSQTIHKPSAPSDVHYSSIPELAAPAGAVKYRYDGGAPSGTEMRMAHPNEVMELPGNNEPVELPGHKP
jgi:LPXTG-motif cell wall-anchored protein